MRAEAVREAERRWRASGSLEDEVSFLVARRRAGELTEERLRLAAHCGHPAAARAHDLTPPTPVAALRDLTTKRFGPAAVRSCRDATDRVVAEAVGGQPMRLARAASPLETIRAHASYFGLDADQLARRVLADVARWALDG